MSTATAKEWVGTFHSTCASGVLKAVPRSRNVTAKGLVLRCLRGLEELGYDLVDLTCLSDVHLQALARFWLHTDKPEFKRNARLEALHAFIAELTGSAPRSRVTTHVACARAVLSACRAARSLCWTGIGLDVDGMLRRIALRDPYVAMQLSLQRVYGLTIVEVLTLRPHDADPATAFSSTAIEAGAAFPSKRWSSARSSLRPRHWPPIPVRFCTRSGLPYAIFPTATTARVLRRASGSGASGCMPARSASSATSPTSLPQPCRRAASAWGKP